MPLMAKILSQSGVKRVTRAGDFMAPIIATAAALSPPEDGDSYDEEGFLICGKCGTRRETLISMPDFYGDGKTVMKKVRTQCKCRTEADAAAEAEKLKNREMEAIKCLKRQSLMDERLSDATFGSFSVNKNNAKNQGLCKRYVEKFDIMLEKNQGMLFYGDVGTGKTFAAACIANHLIERRIPVVMTSFVKLLDSMQNFRDEDSVMINRLNRAKLLIIDDLGAERGTDFALEKVYNIVDSRYRARLPLILTTNLSLSEMKNAVDIRYTRIYDRIFEICYPMQFAGQSWRKSEAARRFNDMKTLLEDTDG